MSESRFPYPIHPMALLFPPKSDAEMAITKSNMVCRQEQGLPPLHDDNSKVAEVREFFEDSCIPHQKKRTDEKEVFMFVGSAADEKKLLAFLSNMLGVRGPVKLEITLSPPDVA